jgi:penicillin-binding protein 1C
MLVHFPKLLKVVYPVISRLRAKLKTRHGISLLAALLLLGTLALFADWLYPPNLQRAQQHSALVVDRDGVLLRGFTTADHIWRLPLQTAQVDPLFVKILIAYEDQRFYQHPGVDPLALARAFGQWLWHGRIVSGASTLTMQTARLLEPRPRTLGSKLIEMLRALQLEWHYDKQEILGLYLTLAPYGGNLEGLRAASLAYLGKEPQRLTAAEAALLAVLPQSPTALRPDRFTERARAARDKVLQRMETVGVLSKQQVTEARAEAVPVQRQAMPMHAPHLAQALHSTQPQREIQRTTLHFRLQQVLETLAER